MAPRSRIETDLTADDLAEFRHLLTTGRLTIDGLTTWLEGKGYEISRSAVGRYARNFETVEARLRQSRETTEALVRELGDAGVQGKQGRLLVEMVRSLVFDMLTKMSDTDGLTSKDVMMLAKGLADLGRALRLDQDFETKIREQVAREERDKAATAAGAAVKEAGLSERTAAAIRSRIFGAT